LNRSFGSPNRHLQRHVLARVAGLVDAGSGIAVIGPDARAVLRAQLSIHAEIGEPSLLFASIFEVRDNPIPECIVIERDDRRTPEMDASIIDALNPRVVSWSRPRYSLRELTELLTCSWNGPRGGTISFIDDSARKAIRLLPFDFVLFVDRSGEHFLVTREKTERPAT
jgi:hypothetical protein